ncbi:zinc finger protein 761-like [Bicyclus anynana]|uniref:Zinc finger protein 761-like n=1 Tax=Bicyclus anynana TaxID=110368 RepID=A0A6J1MWL4_BICAN|nr:zinc finger protein 761-like [Bicyclus anynana]
MKMNKKRVNMEEYYSSLLNMPLPLFSKDSKRKPKCRVCLQAGDMPIASVKKPRELEEALNIFGGILLEDDDEKPMYLCYVCYKFLKSAILFRKAAQRSNEALKEPSFKQSPDHFQDYDYSGPLEDTKSNDDYSNNEFQCKLEPIQVDRKVQCPICKKIVNKPYYYKTHLKLHDPNLPEPYVCDICGKSFKIKNVYTNHRVRHETRFIYKCELCPYVGRYKERLSRHMRVHIGDLKYLCTQCPARYISKGSLSDHIKLKHTEPQFKCDSCNKAFHSSLNLQRHIDVAHLRIKRHECNICGSAFGYRHDLLKHQRQVHKRAALRHRFKTGSKAMSNNNSE